MARGHYTVPFQFTLVVNLHVEFLARFAVQCFQGEGAVNGGAGLYKFLVTALDSDISGAGITRDKIRIRIWQENTGGVEIVLYDSGLGAVDTSGSGGATPLSGGSITIHKARKK